MQLLGMETNTENGIGIFGITFRIYSKIRLGDCVCQEIISLSKPRIYTETGTEHDQFELRKVRSGVFMNYLELGSLCMLNCFLTTCNSRRRPSICKFKFRSVCVTCKMRCQHESIDSIVKTESSSNRTICGEA